MNSQLDKKFENIRELFPHKKKMSYFNSASYGPFCTPVTEAISQNLELRLLSERDDSHDAFTTRIELRKAYAELIGAKQDDIGIGLNTTHGLNIAAFGLPLNEGDEILVSDVEFPAIAYTFRAAAERYGYQLTYIPSKNRMFDIDELEKSISGKTRVLALSFVQFFNGYKNDLQRIAEICKQHKIYFVVDGIQGMGVEPIDVKELGIDIFTSGCQKWMLSPQGCGFFYVSEELRDKIKDPFMSWLGSEWHMKFHDLFKYNQPFFDSSERFEMGYYAVLNLLGMKAAVGLFQKLGIEHIRKHNYNLIDRLASYIKRNPYYLITSSLNDNHRSSIFTFTCKDTEKLHRQLLSENIVLVRREGSIRVSVHMFNNEQDIERLIKVLDDFQE